MTRSDTLKILMVIRAGYPNFYKDMSDDDTEAIILLWSMMFEAESAKIVTESVKSLMCTLKFPPTIADVKEKIALLTQPKAATEMEAWGKVLVAIQSANYKSQEGFDNLPPIIQKIVGSPNQLREWAMMESEVVNSVVSSNFQRSYKARVTSDKEYASLPESAKDLMLESRIKMIGTE